MADDRPDPDQLLAQVQAEEARAGRGRLRVFFGASAGVGKTYAMLEAALAARAAGKDVVVGYVEPHGRRETERMLETLESLPLQPVRYRGMVRQEFDLDAALQRRPEILLVDELAHSNVVDGEPPPRHAKRWQDIAELCDAGINVWTTLNVQHLESLNDLIAQITGIRQRETIPDHVLDEADEIELIDLPPDDLLQRLQQGKVYMADQVGTAVERFFRKANLMALRELALRRTADRVDAAVRAQGLPGSQSRAYLARDRLLVAIGPDAQAEQLVRTGKRIADALDAEWTVVYVETPALQRLSAAERDRRIDILRLAESLGASTVTLDGPTAATALMEYARTLGATRVLVGEPKRRGWQALLRPSTATELVKHARGFDVLVVARQGEERAWAGKTPPGPVARSPMVALRLGGGGHRGLHRRRLPDGSDFFRDQCRHDLRAGRDDRRAPTRPWTRYPDRHCQRCGIRFLFRTASNDVPGERCAVRDHVSRHARRHAHHRQPDGQRAAAEPRRRRS